MKQVKMYELKKIYYPNSISSGGFGPCIALCVYDPKTKSGYMLHDDNLGDMIENSLNEIIGDYGSAKGLVAFATGASIDNDDFGMHKDYELKNRQEVEKILTKYFKPSQLTIDWLAEDCYAELILHTKTGKFELVNNS